MLAAIYNILISLFATWGLYEMTIVLYIAYKELVESLKFYSLRQ